MPNIQVINPVAFNGKFWKEVPDFKFTASDNLCPLTSQELPGAMLDMPIGFVKNGNEIGIVAVLGLFPDHNLFVNEEGRWLGRYVPAAYRSYPFLLARNPDVEDQLVFCIDADSGLITEDDSKETFFDSDGSISKRLKELANFGLPRLY